mmetsp:Transcript_6103/g.18202  ORF Transcript_6103/g.18202 Transcript_6103/m.18202 type:complete len:311 (+) Transcript_6103:239-1171(+)
MFVAAFILHGLNPVHSQYDLFKHDLAYPGHHVSEFMTRVEWRGCMATFHVSDPRPDVRDDGKWNILYDMRPFLDEFMGNAMRLVTPGRSFAIAEMSIGFQGAHAKLKQRCGKAKRAGDGFQADALGQHNTVASELLLPPAQPLSLAHAPSYRLGVRLLVLLGQPLPVAQRVQAPRGQSVAPCATSLGKRFKAADLVDVSGDVGGSGARGPLIGDGHVLIDVYVAYARKGKEKKKDPYCGYPRCELSAANARGACGEGSARTDRLDAATQSFPCFDATCSTARPPRSTYPDHRSAGPGAVRRAGPIRKVRK